MIMCDDYKVLTITHPDVENGLGCRVTIWASGCPHHCPGCHNPQSWDFKGGNEMSVQELLDIIKDDEFANVTFSGGEPLSHPDFLLSCLQLLKGKTHRALQTSGYAAPEVFNLVLQELDYVLYDIKLVDAAQHQHYIGASNGKILANFRTLCRSGIPFVVRTPLIPGVTDTVENLTAIAALLKENGVNHIELLPYNQFAGGKYAAVDMEFKPSFDETVPSQPRTEIFEHYGIHARIM